MSNEAERFHGSVKKLKKDLENNYGYVDPEQFTNYVNTVLDQRGKKSTEQLQKKHDLETLTKAFEWGKETFSDSEFEDLNLETILVRYIGECPDAEVSLKEVKRFFNSKGELRPFVKDQYSSPIRMPDGEHYQVTGEVREVEEKKPSTSTRWLSEQEAQKMPLDELGKLMSKIKE